jgi:polyphosphate glucokinase
VINDAELQGYGVIRGKGVELVLTLGTGMGSGVYSDGRLLPNLELGHQPFRKGRTYEERIGNAARERIGNKRWRMRVRRVIRQLEPIWNYDRLYLGGGNGKKIDFEVPDNVELFVNEQGLRGGMRLWDDLGRGEDA